MIKILNTKEVAEKIGRSVRRTQELINGVDLPRLEIRENGKVLLGARPEAVKEYIKRRDVIK